MQSNNKHRAGYLSKNRNINILAAICGVVWGILEWLSGSLILVGAAALLVALSVFNILSIGDESQKPSRDQ